MEDTKLEKKPCPVFVRVLQDWHMLFLKHMQCEAKEEARRNMTGQVAEQVECELAERSQHTERKAA